MSNYIVVGSVSQALTLGNNFLNCMRDAKSIAEAISATVIAEGRIDAIFHDIRDGFLSGRVHIETDKQKIVHVYFQNEFLLAQIDDTTLIESPDIISLVDIKSGMAITTDSLKYGLRVILLKINAPAFWLEEKAKNLVKPDVLALQGKNNAK